MQFPMVRPSKSWPISRPVALAARILVATLVLSITTAPACAGGYTCNRVLDGDTIHLVGRNAEITLRLFGIDAPETSKSKRDPGQPFSQVAARHLAGLVLNKAVEFKSYGADRYGRTLAVVFVDGRDVNLDLLRVGLAEVYRGASAPGPQMATYRETEKEARSAGRGMWALGESYVSPREWRERRKNAASPKPPPGRHFLSSLSF
jgi:endonuclease YncB( thermonuclease family)